MTRSMKWFDRKFEFDLELWMYGSIVERLRGTPARLEERVGELSDQVLKQRDGREWSIQEHSGHLWDLEPLWKGRLDDFVAGEKTLRPADLENRKTHDAHHNDSTIEQLLSGFRSDRREVVKILDAADDEFVLATALHPRLNKGMRVIDLAFFVAEHDDHHLALITQLIDKFA